jgi:hypothetical protein
MRSTGTDRPAIAPMAGNSTEQRGRIKSPSFEFNGDRRKYVTTAKPLSIPKRLVCEGFEAPKANADSVGGDKERIEDFETNLNHNLYRTWNRMSPGSIVPAGTKAVAVPKKIGGNTFSASRLSATFSALGFGSTEFRFHLIFPLAS